MADFCKQCSKLIFGRDHKDFANLMPPDKYTLTEGALVLCEQCGPTTVDIEGRCMHVSCPIHGKASEEYIANEQKRGAGSTG